MAERKVLVKYYPPDFDPKFLKKNTRTVEKQDNVRMMMPLTCRCNTCGNYAGIGTKYNMRKETCLDENYLGIRIYRFYFRCSQCYSEITFKTDPKNHDYIVEHGATRNYDAQRDIQAAEQVLKEIRENDEEGNAMAVLENRTNDNKREIDINDALEELRHMNKRQTKISPDQLLRQMLLYQVTNEEDEYDDEEKLQIEQMQDKLNVKRLRRDDDVDDEGENLDNQENDEEQQKKYAAFGLQNIERGKGEKKFKTIIKKKQILEGENIINILEKICQKKEENQQQQQKKEEKIASTSENKPKGLSALCNYSDSD